MNTYICDTCGKLSYSAAGLELLLDRHCGHQGCGGEVIPLPADSAKQRQKITGAKTGGVLLGMLLTALFMLTMTSATAGISPTPTAEVPSVEAVPPAVRSAPLQTISIEIPAPAPDETPAPSRYAGISISEEDVETLARLVWLEARGEPFDGQVAVVEVVLNRILSPSFPATVSGVVYQTNQFSPAGFISSTTATETQYEAVAVAIDGQDPVTDVDVVYFSVGAYNSKIFSTIGNHIFCRE